MKISSDCSGECCVCACAGGCLAGHGDDYYRLASKEKIIDNLNEGRYPYGNDREIMIETLKKEYGYDYNTTDILDEPEVDVVEMNDIMIVSMYDGGYIYSMAVNGRLITDDDDSDADDPYEIWKAFCCYVDKRKALRIMNEYNVSKVIICADGCIEIFEKRGNELRKML